MKLIFSIFFFFIAFFSPAQDFRIFLEGQVTEYLTPKEIKRPILTLSENGKVVSEIIGTRRGKWYFNLKPEQFYILKCSKEGLVSKSFIIDTRGVDLSEDYIIYLQITLFEEIGDFDSEFFKLPIAWSKYERSIRNMSWNNSFTEQKMIIYNQIMKEYIKVSSGYYNREGL
jgi:hypothetical protein